MACKSRASGTHWQVASQHHVTRVTRSGGVQSNCMPDDISRSGGRTAGGPVHMLIGHAGAPLSWAVNPNTPPYYHAVELRHGYLRVRANRTALAMQARSTFTLCTNRHTTHAGNLGG